MTEHTTRDQTTSDTSLAAERLRNVLVDQLREQGTVRSERIESALRAVPRHLFVPDVPVEKAYVDEAIYTKDDGTGASISAASQPTIVAMMLEQLRPEPGERVLELGAGTGYNAAVLASLVGKEGHVTTLDIDDDLVDGARTHLARARVANVQAILNDGALGYPDGAPYDRIVATVGAHGIPLAWLEQLAPNGRLVVPLRVRGSVSRSIAFEKSRDQADGTWRSVGSEMAVFMPLRGIADDAHRTVPLNAHGLAETAVTLQTHQEQTVDPAALDGVLDERSTETWTGVAFGGSESQEWMFLWLTCSLANGLSRMPVEQSAVDSGVIKPQFGWGCMATVEKSDLAYLTTRRSGLTADGGTLWEIGVIGHGPSGDELARRVAETILMWDLEYRHRTADFHIRPMGSAPVTPSPGQFILDTPINQLVVTWH